MSAKAMRCAGENSMESFSESTCELAARSSEATFEARVAVPGVRIEPGESTWRERMDSLRERAHTALLLERPDDSDPLRADTGSASSSHPRSGASRRGTPAAEQTASTARNKTCKTRREVRIRATSSGMRPMPLTTDLFLFLILFAMTHQSSGFEAGRSCTAPLLTRRRDPGASGWIEFEVKPASAPRIARNARLQMTGPATEERRRRRQARGGWCGRNREERRGACEWR